MTVELLLLEAWLKEQFNIYGLLNSSVIKIKK